MGPTPPESCPSRFPLPRRDQGSVVRDRDPDVQTRTTTPTTTPVSRILDDLVYHEKGDPSLETSLFRYPITTSS